MSENKLRADIALVHAGLTPSRNMAQTAIREGRASANGVPVKKPGALVDPASLTLEGSDEQWVSRSALKLIHGLDTFGMDPGGCTCLDIGASTGGFCQVLLARGAKRIYAIDVGHDQLHPDIAGDDRVVELEGINSKDLTCEHVPEPADLLVADLSFISLEKALPAALSLLAPAARLCLLIKPQFEVGPAKVGKGGIVRDPAARQAACDAITAWLIDSGWSVLGVTESPMTGTDGNVEFLIGARREQ